MDGARSQKVSQVQQRTIARSGTLLNFKAELFVAYA